MARARESFEHRGDLATADNLMWNLGRLGKGDRAVYRARNAVCTSGEWKIQMIHGALYQRVAGLTDAK